MTIEHLRRPLERSETIHRPIKTEADMTVVAGGADSLVCASSGDRTCPSNSRRSTEEGLSSRTKTIAGDQDEPAPHPASRQSSTVRSLHRYDFKSTISAAGKTSCGGRTMDRVPFELTLLSAGASAKRRFVLASSEIHMAFLIVQQHGSPAELRKDGQRICRISLGENGIWHLAACH